MAEDKNMYMDDGKPIEWLKKNADNFIDKTTLIFGGSNTGKTTLIKEIMYFCKPHIPMVLVIAPSPSDRPYLKKVPAKCIKEDLSKARLESIWRRQNNFTQVYNIANDINVLKRLFDKAESKHTAAAIFAMETATRKKIEDIDNDNMLDFAQKQEAKDVIEAKCQSRLMHFYKMGIREHYGKLMGIVRDRDERIALEYLDANPRFMIIVDDCSEKLKTWMKYFKRGEINIFENIFYKGRHNYITLLIATHDDKLIDPEFRKNARVMFFMGTNMLMAAIGRGANGFTPQQKKDAMKIANYIFGNEEKQQKTKNFKKLCYIKEDPNPFKYTIANMYPEFTMGSSALWDLCNLMPSKNDSTIENPFVKSLVRPVYRH